MTVWGSLIRGQLGGGPAVLFRLCEDALRTEWRFFVPLIAASLLAGLLVTLPPLIIAHLIDRTVAGGSIGILSLGALGILAAFAGVAFADAVLTWFRHRYAVAAQIKLRTRIVPKLLDSGLRQQVILLRENSRASMIRSFDDLDQTIAFLTVTLPEFFGSAMLAASYAALLAFVDPLLAAISLVVMLLAFVTTALLAKHSHRAFAAWLMDRDRTFTLIVEAFVALLTIKTMNAHRAVASRFLHKLETENGTLTTLRQATAATETASRAWMGITPGLVVLYGLWQVDNGAMTIGDLVLFLSVTASLAAPVASLCQQWEAAQRSLAAIGRIAKLRAGLPENLETDCSPAWRPGEDIEMNKVHHRYSDATSHSLQNVNLKLVKGDHVAVTGRSGSGKTTLAHILARVIEPSEGQVLNAGVAINTIDLSVYRRHVLMLPHQTHIFTTSIAMNIALWEDTWSMADIRTAAETAGLSGVVDGLPDGYQTRLSADGQPLSAGQIQRLGIARALLRRPDILVLDEATSSLDPETEANVMKNIRAVMRGKTLVMVTHREALAASFPLRLQVSDGHVFSVSQSQPRLIEVSDQ